MENCLPVIEEKKYECPKILDGDVKGDKPKTEVRHLLFEKGNCAPGKAGSEGKKPCCPQLHPNSNRMVRLIKLN